MKKIRNCFFVLILVTQTALGSEIDSFVTPDSIREKLNMIFIQNKIPISEIQLMVLETSIYMGLVNIDALSGAHKTVLETSLERFVGDILRRFGTGDNGMKEFAKFHQQQRSRFEAAQAVRRMIITYFSRLTTSDRKRQDTDEYKYFDRSVRQSRNYETFWQVDEMKMIGYIVLGEEILLNSTAHDQKEHSYPVNRIHFPSPAMLLEGMRLVHQILSNHPQLIPDPWMIEVSEKYRSHLLESKKCIQQMK